MVKQGIREFEEIMSDQQLPSSAKLVYYLIAKGCSGEDGACKKTNEQMKKALGIKSVGTVSKLVRLLVKRGYVWSETHGRSERLLRLGQAPDEKGKESRPQSRREPKRSRSLCWSCVNAIPSGTTGCSWSESFQPVSGWNAERNDLYVGQTNEQESYIVQSCPEFVEG